MSRLNSEKSATTFHRFKKGKDYQVLSGAVFVIVFIGIGVHFLFDSRAASPYVAANATTGVLAGGATIQSNANASNGEYVQFGSSSTTSPTDPSGVPLPTSPPAGYTTDFTDDFQSSTLNSNWNPYSGQPGTDTGGWWAPSHVTLSNGMLVLRTYQDPTNYHQTAGTCATCPSGWDWVEGGMSLKPAGVLTDGEYLVRSRVTSATGVTQVELLYPNNNQWPPEIDFNESNGTNESTATFISGLSSSGSRIQTQSRNSSVDITQWHTWGVIVTPSTITYTLDGQTWATMANTEDVAMKLTIQQQVWEPGDQYETPPSASTPSEVDMDVAWVAVYQPT